MKAYNIASDTVGSPRLIALKGTDRECGGKVILRCLERFNDAKTAISAALEFAVSHPDNSIWVVLDECTPGYMVCRHTSRGFAVDGIVEFMVGVLSETDQFCTPVRLVRIAPGVLIIGE